MKGIDYASIVKRWSEPPEEQVPARQLAFDLDAIGNARLRPNADRKLKKLRECGLLHWPPALVLHDPKCSIFRRGGVCDCDCLVELSPMLRQARRRR